MSVPASMQANRMTNLQAVPDIDLIAALYQRNYTPHDVEAAYYALEEMASEQTDRVWGTGEEGRHGKGSTG